MNVAWELHAQDSIFSNIRPRLDYSHLLSCVLSDLDETGPGPRLWDGLAVLTHGF